MKISKVKLYYRHRFNITLILLLCFTYKHEKMYIKWTWTCNMFIKSSRYLSNYCMTQETESDLELSYASSSTLQCQSPSSVLRNLTTKAATPYEMLMRLGLPDALCPFLYTVDEYTTFH